MALLCLSYSVSKAQVLDPTQVYITGNIVQDTIAGSGTTPWTGGVYQNELTCWAGGQPGYCGPSPIVRPGNNINFSYGSSYIYQQQDVSGLVPNVTGLRINGYTFGFTAKNGNGWDDGRTDQLTALVRFWDSTGGRASSNLLYGNSYNLNYKFNWTTFNYNETFAQPLSLSSIGKVQYGFLGRDNNGWAGPYGPEVNSVNFSVKYSVDPCVSDPTYSPTCPGYLQAITSKLPKAEPIATTTTTEAPTPTVTTTPVAVVETTSTTTSSPTIATTATVSASNTQPKVGEIQVSGGQSKTTLSTSQILSIVRSEQTRISGVESSTVQQANEQAATASQNAQSTAQSVAATAVTSSMSSSSVYQSMAARSSSFSVTNSALQQGGTTNYSIAPQAGRTVEIETPKTESATDSRSVLNDFMQPKPQVITETQQQQSTSSVNRAAKDNDAAAGVSLTAMIKQPIGYESYMSGLVDRPFYPPKEIYKNQKTVDNARAERLLNAKSDQLHQQMVDQQYNLGK